MEINGVRPAMDVMAVKSPDFEKQSEMAKVEGLKPFEAKAVDAKKDESEKSEEIVREAVDKLNKTAVIFDRSLRFQIHDKTHRTMVSVIDIASDKVIRQIPTEEVLDLVAKMDDYLGLIFDKKA